MSLINQMLRDLESRDADKLDAVGVDGLAWSAHGAPPATRRRLARGLGLFLLLGAGGLLAWQGIVHRGEMAPPGAPVPDTIAAAPATPAPVTPVAASPVDPPASPAPAHAAVPTTRPAPAGSRRVPASPKQAAAPAAPPAGEVRIVKQARPLSGAERAARFYQQGYDYLLAERHAEAEQALRRALAADAGHAQAREMLVGQLLRRGELAEAGELLREGLGLAPRNARFAKLYARLLVEQNAVPTAIHILRSALPPMAQDPEYHALLAALYQRQGEHRAAAGLYRDLVKLRGDVAVWWVGLGVSLESLGKPAEARLAYTQAGRLPRLDAALRQYVKTRLRALGGAA